MLRWLVPIALGAVVLLTPTPAGLSPAAWHYFALFVAVIGGLITEPMPGPAVGFVGVAFATAIVFVGKTPAEALRWGLSGFSNDTVWLIFAANMFAVGYEVTGLGRRLALLLVKKLGRSTLGLGYAIGLADLILAPFMPSVTARSGGTIYPIVKSIPPIYGSYADDNPRKIGSYLMWTAFATASVTSGMFLTSFAPNVLATEIGRKITGVQVSWGTWAMGSLPVCLLLFIATPLLCYFLYPPVIKHSTEVAEWAGKELQRMGAISRREVTMAVLALAALAAWISASRWISATSVALVVISLMLLTKVITWSDIAVARQAWNVFVWFATLVVLAEGLSSVGFLSWFAKRSAALTTNIPVTAAAIAIVAVFFAVHYLIASGTAQTAALLPVFLAAAVTIKGLPLRPVVLLLLYSLGLMGVITPYANGPAPIYFSSGYVPVRDFWRLGFILGLFNLIVLLGIGLPWVMHILP
jgi:L-tartrate/succinate antiporter